MVVIAGQSSFPTLGDSDQVKISDSPKGLTTKPRPRTLACAAKGVAVPAPSHDPAGPDPRLVAPASRWPRPTGFTGNVLKVGDRGAQVGHLRHYLQRFGHLQSDHSCACPDQVFCPHLKGGVVRYQRFFGLSVTGVLDEATQVQMAKPLRGARPPTQ